VATRAAAPVAAEESLARRCSCCPLSFVCPASCLLPLSVCVYRRTARFTGGVLQALTFSFIRGWSGGAAASRAAATSAPPLPPAAAQSRRRIPPPRPPLDPSGGPLVAHVTSSSREAPARRLFRPGARRGSHADASPISDGVLFLSVCERGAAVPRGLWPRPAGSQVQDSFVFSPLARVLLPFFRIS